MYVGVSTFSNIFFPETTGSVEAKFHVEPPWDRGNESLSRSHTKMPIYGKNLKKIFFSGTKRLLTLKLDMQHRVHKYYQICSNDDPGLTLSYFTVGQIWSLMLL